MADAKTTYKTFLSRKSQVGGQHGFDPLWLPACLKDFQHYLVDWKIRRGRGAIIVDCGLGKSPMELIDLENAIRHSNRPALLVTPLAVAGQMAREADKFGVEARVSRDGTVHKNVTITNYQKLHLFDPADFCAVNYDEASAIKAFDGKLRKQATRFLAGVPHRGMYTATAAPNDYVELGTLSEALGELSQSDMLSMFFRASDRKRHSLFREGEFWNRPKWFFRPHAEVPFWRWVASWARAARSPEDLGFDGSEYVLPELKMEQHLVDLPWTPPGELFPLVARTLAEQRAERNRSLRERCEKVAELVAHDEPAVCWCQYNAEGDLLEQLIPGCVQVAGKDSDEAKEERLTAFASGQVRVLVIKPKIGAWGLNWQHCGHHTFFPSHSYEQFYQAISRSRRFGRKGRVRVDIVATAGEAGVTANLQKKQERADHLYKSAVREMNRHASVHQDERHTKGMEVPVWL